MILYRITPAEGRTEWHGTRDQAQAEGRRIAGFMMKTRVEQCHVRDDKEGLLAALNGRPILGVPSPARAWQFTKRGGLTEVGADGFARPDEPHTRQQEEAENDGRRWPPVQPDRTGQEPDMSGASDEPALDPKAPALRGLSPEEQQALDDWKSRHRHAPWPPATKPRSNGDE